MSGARAGNTTHIDNVIIASARASYGRLVALLASRDGDIASSEDALSEAFAAALKTWPKAGVPDNPDAWLLIAARNRRANQHRHDEVKIAQMGELLIRFEQGSANPEPIPDRRLALLFVCAHPAIQEDMRTPLMLQAILGLDAATIASAFLVSPTTMGQRLVRVKAKIKAAGIGFHLPDLDVFPDRLEDVLSAIYVAFGTSWDNVAGTYDGNQDLAAEAIFLARVIVALMPKEPEALGLLALMLYIDARREARWQSDGAFVPLKEQNPRLWSRDKIIEAEGLLVSASRLGRFGRFQCEAAIQSVHVQAPITGQTNWTALKTLHEMLIDKRPSVGAYVSYSAVLLAMGSPSQALEVLHALATDDVETYQPYWVTLAAALDEWGDGLGANSALERAIGLTENASVRQFLLKTRR
jgi:RNA polymerase sigma-70 factor, ECF subfamily